MKRLMMVIVLLWAAQATNTWGMNSSNSQPIAFCRTGSYYQTLPLIVREQVVLNLQQIFSGYNLNYTLKNASNYSKIVQLQPKVATLNEQEPNTFFYGLKNYHIQRNGNTWGQSFVALSVRGDKTTAHIGSLQSDRLAPIINTVAVVQNLANTTCFDAVTLPSKNLLVVDCIQRNGALHTLTNYFYYIRMSDGQPLKRMGGDVYVEYDKVMKRELEVYENPQSKHTFLLRTFYADGVDERQKDNTYVEVIMFTDPEKPWVMAIIDRSFLRLPRLRIVDARIYLGNIYILDANTGLYKLSINSNQDISLNGVYAGQGFQKFAVFSSDLENKIEIALGSKDSIYQIDWTDQPLLLGKYSLMSESNVTQLWLNTRFLFVQSNSNNKYNYTWVLNRGQKTYNRAFYVLMHPTNNTLIDLNQDNSQLIVIQEEKMMRIAFDQPRLNISLPFSQDYFDRKMNVTVVATSMDPSSPNKTVSCQFILNFTLLQNNNRSLWAVGSLPPPLYHANFPGQINIPLSSYILGPNISYSVNETVPNQLPKAKVYQGQQLQLSWIVKPPFQNITFLQSQTFNGGVNDTVQVYFQDAKNVTYLNECKPKQRSTAVLCNCTGTQDLEGQIRTWTTTMYISRVTAQIRHIAAYTTSKRYNTVFLLDLLTNTPIQELILGQGFAGNVSSVQLNGKYMYIVLHYVKSILVFDLQLCLNGRCESICNVNHMTLYNLKLQYFAPTNIASSSFHPSALFVKTADSVISLDASRQCVPKLLASFRPVPDVLTEFAFAVNSNYLVVTIPPDRIYEYDISRLYLQEVRLARNYPMYGNELAKFSQVQVSEYGSCVYVTARDSGGYCKVFVYRSGYPAVGALYDVIQLYAFQDLLIDASGYGVDYIAVLTAGKQLRLFRQYETPFALISNPQVDYRFYLTYRNAAQSGTLQLINVAVINLPTNITVSPFLDDIMNTKDLLYSGVNRASQINDSTWYKGNVLYIRPQCYDCGTKIKISNHVELESVVTVAGQLKDYQSTHTGGILQSTTNLFDIRSNGTLRQIMSYSNMSRRECTRVAVGDSTVVSGCHNDNAVLLVITSLVSDKPFVLQEVQSKARYLKKLQGVNGLIMLIDTQPNLQKKMYKGGIYLYAIAADGQDVLTEIYYIDGDDINLLNDFYISNAQLLYDPNTHTFRLYITELTNGVFVMEFQLTGMTIRILQITDLKVVQLLQGINETMPYDATFQAIAVIHSAIDTTLGKYTDSIIFTTGKFHAFQLQTTYSPNGVLFSVRVTKVYLRYAYYTMEDLIRHSASMFVIVHSLPLEYDNGTQSKHLLTVYSTAGDAPLERRGLIGAQPFFHPPVAFDFNLSSQENRYEEEANVHITLVEENDRSMKVYSLHRNLTVFTTEEVDTQIIYIDLINDFNVKKIRILMNGRSTYPEWLFITIILFSIIGAALLFGGVILLVIKLRERSGADRDTLITDME